MRHRCQWPNPDNRPDIDYHGYLAGALARLRTERPYRVFADWSASPGALAEALVDVWQRLGLPFKGHALAAE